MIFDSEAMAKLLRRYDGVPAYEAPAVAHLARSEDRAGERDYLEATLQRAGEARPRDWLGRLVSRDNGNHLGAWFEMMLYGWLARAGPVEIEPDLQGGTPDYAVHMHGQYVVVEARACLIGREERARDTQYVKLAQALYQVRRPYTVQVKCFLAGTKLQADQLIADVTAWLDTTPSEPHEFADRYGNRVSFEATLSPGQARVAVFGHDGYRVDPEPVKTQLHRKARKYAAAVRATGHPCVIALFLENIRWSAEEVIEAWYGRLQVPLDADAGQASSLRWDQSGLHFLGEEIQHTTVSGTLVFEAQWNPAARSRELSGKYVQNPYAATALKVDSFPVEDRFIVFSQGPGGYRLGWASRRAQEFGCHATGDVSSSTQ